ncbi:choice-of-anchor J domain-containing protein [Tenacibaculum sp. 190524A02b]|uniref:choice-of-anchor J domain-containing protein n=1 Tax=Tenacibaculum vairaonense TaxID=3137860 RepID=UPI0032B2BF2D
MRFHSMKTFFTITYAILLFISCNDTNEVDLIETPEIQQELLKTDCFHTSTKGNTNTQQRDIIQNDLNYYWTNNTVSLTNSQNITYRLAGNHINTYENAISNAAAVLNALSNSINITLAPTNALANTVDITINCNDTGRTWGQFPNNNNIGRQIDLGEGAFRIRDNQRWLTRLIIHEFLHTLGLRHPVNNVPTNSNRININSQITRSTIMYSPGVNSVPGNIGNLNGTDTGHFTIADLEAINTRYPVTAIPSITNTENDGSFMIHWADFTKTSLGDWTALNNSEPQGALSSFRFDNGNGARSNKTTSYIVGTSETSNWLISPKLYIKAGDQITFRVRAASGTTESYFELRLSDAVNNIQGPTPNNNNANDVGSFNTILRTTVQGASGAWNFPNNNGWQRYTVTIPNSAGNNRQLRKIALIHKSDNDKNTGVFHINYVGITGSSF